MTLRGNCFFLYLVRAFPNKSKKQTSQKRSADGAAGQGLAPAVSASVRSFDTLHISIVIKKVSFILSLTSLQLSVLILLLCSYLA